MTATILILTIADDFYSPDLVADEIRRSGAKSVRLNTDLYPSSMVLTQNLPNGEFTFVCDDGCISSSDIVAVYARRLWPGARQSHVDVQYQSVARRDSRTAFLDAFSTLTAAKWVNAIGPTTKAESKVHQLRVAHKIGIDVPDTIVTNNPDDVRAFYEKHSGRIVTKLLAPFQQSMQATSDFVYTSRVNRSDLIAIDSVRHCPQIFQEEIKKARELRVVVVDDAVFTGAIDTKVYAHHVVDWRQLTTKDDVRWMRASLPTDVERKVLAMNRKLGLVYGAYDFIVTDDDKHVFLEVNSAGEWGWLERDLSFPIARAIADSLLGATL